MDSKNCSACKVTKPLGEFYPGAKYILGVRNQCKECMNKKKRITRIENIEKARNKDSNYMAEYNKTVKGKYYTIKTNLKARGIAMEMSCSEFVDWWDKQDKKCHYCGVTLVRDKKSYHNLTIDRIDNSLPYTVKNIVLCCWMCNVIKGSWFSEQQMAEIANKYLKKRIK